MKTKYVYDMSCLFDGFRIDHQTVRAYNDKEAKQKTKMCYQTKYKHLVTDIRVFSRRKM